MIKWTIVYPIEKYRAQTFFSVEDLYRNLTNIYMIKSKRLWIKTRKKSQLLRGSLTIIFETKRKNEIKEKTFLIFIHHKWTNKDKREITEELNKRSKEYERQIMY